MELVKKNMVSLICGGVILLAIAAIFWPIQGYYQQLETKANARKAVATSLHQLLTKDRKKPILDLNSTDAESLDQFPTQPVIEQWKSVTEQVKAESQKMYQTAIALNEKGHDLLVPDVLPSGSVTSLLEFRDRYLRMMDQTTAATRKQTIAAQILQGGYVPTAAEITERRTAAEKALKDSFPKNMQGQPYNPQLYQEQLRQTLLQVPDDLMEERAKSIKCYIDLSALTPYDPLMRIAGRTPDTTQVFVAQLGLWVQQDVLHSLADANKDSKDVTQSPVKHLLRIGLEDPTFKQFTTPLTPGTPAAAAAAGSVTEDPSVAPAPNYAKSPTGRVSNGLYDVVHFNLKINVDAEQIPRVLQELSKNKFITVTSTSVLQIDNGAMKAKQYDYGSKPIVQLDLQCEELFMRHWMAPLMPAQVRTNIGLPATPPAPAAATPAQ